MKGLERTKIFRMEQGYYIFKLRQLLYDKNVSINRLMRDTQTDFKTIKKMMTGELVRVDIIVLARFCDYLECDITDIFEYVRSKDLEDIPQIEKIKEIS